MQVVYHLGAHCTDDDRLVRSLGRNRTAFAEEGILVPAPRRYRQVMREVRLSLRGRESTDEIQEALLDAIIEEDRAKRLILSHELFLSAPNHAVTGEGFYAMLGRRLKALANIFPSAECEFHLALRNPATLIPALVARHPEFAYEGMMGGQDPTDLRWRPTIENAIETNPGVKLVLWCNEDTPFIWTDIMRRISGVGSEFPLQGELDLLSTLVTEEGLEKLGSALGGDSRPGADERHQIIAATLEEHARPDALEMEIELPDWTTEMVETITLNYEADIAAIAAMPGVELVAP
ncbi:hypothetical protein [Ostreiculturibacter nitratireducens]|uniref:hypothetical protein n=1 Tax=Ostreiculturibacter nitratireducens TaxID=3075226 RepID=UPI0031B587C9